MIQKHPRNFIFVGQQRRQGFDAKGLGGVVAAVKHIQAGFFRQGVSPMLAFAGDKGVHAFAGRDGQIVARTTGDNADAFAPFVAARNDSWFHAGGTFQPLGELRPGNLGARLKTDGLAVTGKKRF